MGTFTYCFKWIIFINENTYHQLVVCCLPTPFLHYGCVGLPCSVANPHVVHTAGQQGYHSNGIRQQIQRRQSYGHMCAVKHLNVCVFASTLCKYDFRKGNLFVLSWVRVLCLGSVSSVVFKGGSGLCSIVLFCRLGRCFVTMLLYIVVRLVFCLVL